MTIRSNLAFVQYSLLALLHLSPCLIMASEENTAIFLKSNVVTQITSLEYFIDDMTFSHPSKAELMEMKGYLNNLTARLDDIITPAAKIISDTNCTQLVGTKENFEMVLADIAKILAQIEVIGVTGNNEVDTYLADLKSYYIGVEADVRSTVSALQLRISLECTEMTSSSVIHTRSSTSLTSSSVNHTTSSTSFTSFSIDGTKTEISSESGEFVLETTKSPPNPTTLLDHLKLTTERGHLLTTIDGQHILTTREGHLALTTKGEGHHLLTTPKGHLLTTEANHPLLTTGSAEKLTTRRRTTSTRASSTAPSRPGTLATSLTTSGLCCRIKTVSSGSLQGRSAINSNFYIGLHTSRHSTLMSMKRVDI